MTSKKEPESKLIAVLNFFFGRRSSERFRRLVELLILVAIIFILAQNIEFSYSKKTGWTFNWKPAADISIKK